MCKFTSKACLLLIVLLSPAIHAAGLGRLTINSALGQPFQAEIDLVAVKKEEKQSLMARLASQDTFRQANVDYLPLLSTFKTSIENRSDGQPYVRIISSQPINEPFLNMLIELNWPAGRLLREYTVLLAPPEIDAHPPTTAPGQSNRSDAPASAPTKAESATFEKSGLPNRGSVGEKPPMPESTSVSQAHTVYGPVKQGDTLARIVQNIVPPPGVSVNQMLIALHRANRDAFHENNIHRLKAGAILRVPGGREIDTIGPAEADMEVRMQTADWDRYKLADVVGLIPAAEKPRQTVTGKIDSSVEANAAATQGSPDEILKLSKGEEAWGIDKDVAGKDIDGRSGGGKDSGTEVNGVQDRFRAMEEDVIAKSKSLSEANERVLLLEKNVKELQHLLELKNLVLADMQKKVEAIDPNGATLPDPSVAISSQSGHTPEPVPGTEGEPAIAAGNVEEATPPETVKSATEIAKPLQEAAEKPGRGAVPISQRPVESSLIDDMTANIEYLGGALVLLITGVVAVSMIGRQKEASDNSNVNMVSSAFGSQLHDKAMTAATSVAMAACSTPAATTAARQADEVAPAGVYPTANDIRTQKIPGDVPAGNRGSPRAPETLQTPGDSASSSRPAPSVPVFPASSAERPGGPWLPDVSFNLDSGGPIKSEEFAERNTHWHEIVTKLDLARAYQEMGDKEAAKQVLQEVSREGDVQQQESARLMLAVL